MDFFNTQLPLRIDWSDIDLFGHVNNVSIIRFAQAARVHFLETIGLMQLQYETQNGPILASISCQFRKPMFYPGNIVVYSKAGNLKNTSFEIVHEIYDEQNDNTAQIKDIIVFFDFKNNTKQTIPLNIREKIENLEKIAFK